MLRSCIIATVTDLRTIKLVSERGAQSISVSSHVSSKFRLDLIYPPLVIIVKNFIYTSINGVNNAVYELGL